MKMETQVNYARAERGMDFFARIDDSEVMTRAMAEAVLREIASEIAKRWVAENYQTVVANIDQQAVANLSVAESAAAIRKTLAEKIPDKIMHVHTESVRTQVEGWQRGILGGVKRVY